ncbi:MAG: aldehyde dehydrogenase family protein [Terriglobia bacterium]
MARPWCNIRYTDLIALTGSVETGKRVGQICAAQIKKIHLELGGTIHSLFAVMQIWRLPATPPAGLLS